MSDKRPGGDPGSGASQSGGPADGTYRDFVSQSSVGRLECDEAHVDRSAVATLQARRAVLQQSAAAVVDSQETRAVDLTAAVVTSGKTTVEGTLKTIVHTGPVTGDVHTLLGGRSALIAALSLVSGALIGATWSRRRESS